MIDLRIGEVVDDDVEAILRPVAADWSAVTPAMRRLDLVAGPTVMAQCERLGELPVGSAAITAAGDLDAQFLVHVVVRSRDEQASAATVRKGLLNGLRRLSEWGIASAAIVPLGTGAGNLDAEESAGAMAPVLVDHLQSSPHPGRVVLVVENEYERATFEAALRAAGAAPAVPGGQPD